jgi:hypothetical protein
LRDVHRKLDWAMSRHDEMLRIFEDYLKADGGDERPCGIKWREQHKPQGLVVARFIVDEPMPDDMSMLAADLVHNTRSALDHVLARLKEHLGGTPAKVRSRRVNANSCGRTTSSSRARRVRSTVSLRTPSTSSTTSSRSIARPQPKTRWSS